MDKSSTYPHFHISTATICRFVRTYITIFTNKIAQFQHMGEFTPQQLTKSLKKCANRSQRTKNANSGRQTIEYPTLNTYYE